MKCEEVKNNIIDYIDGTLPETYRKKMAGHIETCDSCQEEYILSGKLLNSLSAIEDEQPDQSIRSDFYQMLETEKKQQAHTLKAADRNIKVHKLSLKLMRYAAEIIILVGFGYLMGNKLEWKNNDNNELAQLKQEVQSMQQNLTLASLSQPTASQRIKAIHTVNAILQPDPDMIKALLNTLNADDNMNVRMAAAYALARYPGSQAAKDALIKAMGKQTDPLMQITLIGILVDLQDVRAKESFKDIINDQKSNPQVKEQAEKGMKAFI